MYFEISLAVSVRSPPGSQRRLSTGARSNRRLVQGASTTTTYDDMQLLDLFVMPWPNSEVTHFRLGIGPYLVFPTSASDRIGNGSWQMGPAAAFGYRGIPRLQIAGLFQQATSFAYTSRKSTPVSSLTFQPILTYQLGNGWYLNSSDTNHADRGMQCAVDSSRFSPISVSADATGNFIYVTRGVDNNPERFRIERFCRCGMPSRSAVC
jgi:hypothetical protein